MRSIPDTVNDTLLDTDLQLLTLRPTSLKCHYSLSFRNIAITQTCSQGGLYSAGSLLTFVLCDAPPNSTSLQWELGITTTMLTAEHPS